METPGTPIEGFDSQTPPTYGAEATDEAHPAEPAQPAAEEVVQEELPVEATEPAEPAETAEPTEPAEPAEPAQPAEPFETAESAEELPGVEGAEQEDVEKQAPDETTERLAGIEAALVAYNDRVATLEELNVKMHSLVEANREATVMKLLQPMFAQLATLYTDLLKATEYAESEGEAQNYREFAERVEYLVSLYDLEVVQAEPGQPFDAALHASAMVKKTDDEEKDKTLVRAVRHGLKVIGAERPLIPTQVVVYRYKAPAQPADNA